MQTPFAVHKQVAIERFGPRVFEAKIYKPTETSQSWKIAKEDTAGPGSYDSITAFEKI